MYIDTVSCVRADGCESEWFPVNSGVPQGCVVAPDAFLVPNGLAPRAHGSPWNGRHVNW